MTKPMTQPGFDNKWASINFFQANFDIKRKLYLFKKNAPSQEGHSKPYPYAQHDTLT